MAIAGLRGIGMAAKKAIEEGVEKVKKSKAAGKPKNQRPSKKKGLTKHKPSDAKTTSKANPPAGGKKPPAKRSTTSPRAKRAAESRAKRTEKVVEGTQKVIKPKRLTEGRAANRSKSPANKRSYKKPTLVAAGAASGAAGYSAAKDDKKSDTKKTASSNKGTVNRTSSVKSVSKPKQSFGSAFKSARSAGKKQFTWNGKKYHTRTKEDEAKSKTKAKTKEPVVKGITYHAKQMEKKGKK